MYSFININQSIQTHEVLLEKIKMGEL